MKHNYPATLFTHLFRNFHKGVTFAELAVVMLIIGIVAILGINVYRSEPYQWKAGCLWEEYFLQRKFSILKRGNFGV